MAPFKKKYPLKYGGKNSGRFKPAS